MALFSPVRTTSSGRRVHGKYNQTYLDEVGRDTTAGIKWRLEQLDKALAAMKFDSLLDAALVMVESGTDDAREQLVAFSKAPDFLQLLAACPQTEKQ